MAVNACHPCGCAIEECECAERRGETKESPSSARFNYVKVLLDVANAEYYYKNMAGHSPPSK